ncbi:MAG: acetyl-CoA carboxylase biotin carboxyl carrier protein subunit [Methanobacteriota archaeon]|nr:MAG: acetyl-CoA carboxylase biotin carboxyl carrier protein subunit [Euryarchaeota archaeon]
MREFIARYKDQEHVTELINSGKSIKVEGKLFKVNRLNGDFVLQDDAGNSFVVEDIIRLPEGDFRVHLNGFSVDLKIEDPMDLSSSDEEVTGEVHAPMAGVVTKILVKEGDTVEKGDHLLLLSAMKMENEITAPTKGVVSKIVCNPNDQVNALDLLLILEPTTE